MACETYIAAMKQYDDAKNVRRMLDKIEGPARRKYDAMMAARFDVAHEKLRLKHKEQQARQHEHIGTIKWSSKRRAEKHASIQRQKCANLDPCRHHGGPSSVRLRASRRSWWSIRSAEPT